MRMSQDVQWGSHVCHMMMLTVPADTHVLMTMELRDATSTLSVSVQ